MDAAGFALIHATGSDPASMQVPTFKLQHHCCFVFFARDVHRPRADFSAEFRLMIV